MLFLKFSIFDRNSFNLRPILLCSEALFESRAPVNLRVNLAIS